MLLDNGAGIGSSAGMVDLIHEESRWYLSAFVAIGWLAIYSCVRIGKDRVSAIYWISTILVAVTMATIVFHPAGFDLPGTQHEYAQAAVALQRLSLQACTNIAVIGENPSKADGAFLARLAHLRIVAELLRPSDYWSATPMQRQSLDDSFHAADAEIILLHTESVPTGANGNG